ncbi:MAG: hypothetical protein ABI175_28655 [Polyangiales bacterium]
MDDEPTPPEPTSPMPPPPPAQASPPRGLAGPPADLGRPSAPASSRTRLGGWLMLAGGAIALASAFLPRITASGPGGEASYGGLAGAGFGTLILAGIAVAKGLQVVRPDVMKMRLGSPVVTGVLMLVLAGFRYASLSSDVADLQELPGITASIGNGFWIGAIGAAMVTVGGALIQSDGRAG